MGSFHYITELGWSLAPPVLLCVLCSPAFAQLSISRSSLEPGGVAVSGSLGLSATMGQPDAGPATMGGGFLFSGGFWPQATSGEVLAIDLISLRVASPVDGQSPVISWVTGAEFNSAGFHLYRGEEVGSGWRRGERLNLALIPAAGDPMGGSTYEFVDPLAYVHGSGPMAYYLEEIDLGGKPALFGPVVLNEEPKSTSTSDWYAY